MLELSQGIALVEVNIMHAQITAARRAKDEDAHAAQELRLQRVERIFACAVNPGVAQRFQPAQEASNEGVAAEEPEAEVAGGGSRAEERTTDVIKRAGGARGGERMPASGQSQDRRKREVIEVANQAIVDPDAGWRRDVHRAFVRASRRIHVELAVRVGCGGGGVVAREMAKRPDQNSISG